MSNLPPLIMTYPQLEAVLLPLTIGYAWGVDTIRDLWLIGAPTPDSNPREEKRIVFPSQLIKWLEDVLNRQGRPLSDAAKTYAALLTMPQEGVLL